MTPAEPLVVLVCGSRDWTNREVIRRELDRLPAGTVLVHGDNGYDKHGKPLWGKPDELAVRGADKLAGAIGRALGFDVRPYTPDWASFGLRAGPIRNTQMLTERPNEILAFTNNLAASKGTRDMVAKGRAAGVPVKVISE